MVRITEALVRKKSEHNECMISTLEEISLHQEDIECIEHLHNWCRKLKILLMQSNLIAKIENLFKLKNLEYLNLAINNIERIENLEQLESLHKLDLTLNFIGELTSIESLRGNYNLRELILTGNPCCDYPNYRSYVVATLPQLESLDCREITKTEQLEAQRDAQKYRAVIVQKQLDYAMERDEQKLRVLAHTRALEYQMSQIENEDERIRTFWNAMSEHCPETRYDIAKYQKLGREKHKPEDKTQPVRRSPQLFAPCGRPYNLNQAKLEFSFQDEPNDYILVLYVYKFMDSSLLDVKIDVNFIRVTVRNKIFQIHLNEEIRTSDASIQRSKMTGHLQIRVMKLKSNEIIVMNSKNSKSHKNITKDNNNKKKPSLNGPVDITTICDSSGECDLPDLI